MYPNKNNEETHVVPSVGKETLSFLRHNMYIYGITTTTKSRQLRTTEKGEGEELKRLVTILNYSEFFNTWNCQEVVLVDVTNLLEENCTFVMK